MTEPTPETLWRDLLEKDDRTSPEEYPDMALITFDEFCYCIDALTAAAIQAERERCAGIADNEAADYGAMYVLEGFREDLRRKDAAARIATLIRRKPAGGPAPEGDAPTLSKADCYEQARELGERYIEIDFSKEKADPIEIFVRLVAPALAAAADLARPRCSTPSQDTGQPGCGAEVERVVADAIGQAADMWAAGEGCDEVSVLDADYCRYLARAGIAAMPPKDQK